jgi:hypothetical protein
MSRGKHTRTACQSHTLIPVSIKKEASFSDLTIKCGADTYNVHKIVAAARSSVFAKALKFPGKVLCNATIAFRLDLLDIGSRARRDRSL